MPEEDDNAEIELTRALISTRISAEPGGLAIPEDTGVEEWTEALAGLKTTEASLFWQIADLLVFARNTWGSSFIRKLSLSRYHLKVMHTGLLFPKGTREHRLSPSHHLKCHEEGLEAPAAEKALALAVRENLSARELQTTLRKQSGKVLPDPSAGAQAASVEYMAFQRAQQFLLRHEPEELDDVAREAMKARLEPFAAYLERLRDL